LTLVQKQPGIPDAVIAFVFIAKTFLAVQTSFFRGITR
jgi:hypothetical protein